MDEAMKTELETIRDLAKVELAQRAAGIDANGNRLAAIVLRCEGLLRDPNQSPMPTRVNQSLMPTRVRRRFNEAAGAYVYDVERYCDYDFIDQEGARVCNAIAGNRWRLVTTELSLEDAKLRAINCSNNFATGDIVFEYGGKPYG